MLVNNAVLQGIGSSVSRDALELFESVVRVNLVGLFHVAREAARMMIAQGGGAIVNVGSNVSPCDPQPQRLCGQQGRRDALTGHGRSTWARTASASTRSPRLHPHRPLADVGRRARRSPPEERPAGKEATADDIAAAVLFLASDAAANISGARLVVDGGCSPSTSRPTPTFRITMKHSLTRK